VITAAAFSFMIAASGRLAVITSGTVLAAMLLLAARIPIQTALQRLIPLNIFMIVLLVILPFSIPGTVLFTLGEIGFSREGLLKAFIITLKGNTIMMGLIVLVSTIEVVRLGHALHHLHVPEKLIHLFLLCVRYIDVLHHEYHRLTKAMKTRCFQPRMDMHTYRTLGHLVAMLLIKSFDRSDRIVAAMKCRGFHGQFHLLYHFSAARRDLLFAALSSAVLLLFIYMEWL
jgi:cobalt/nickel transport system permease protein